MDAYDAYRQAADAVRELGPINAAAKLCHYDAEALRVLLAAYDAARAEEQARSARQLVAEVWARKARK
jgi:hypothetical protein